MSIANRIRKLTPRDIIPAGGPGSVGIAYLDAANSMVVRLGRSGPDRFMPAGDSAPQLPQFFGAAGDGVRDDTTAIQAAVFAAQGTKDDHGALYLPRGVYIVSAPITIGSIEEPAISVFGPGVIKQADGANLEDVVVVAGASNETHGEHFMDLHITVDGNRDNNTTPVTGIRCQRLVGVRTTANLAAVNCDTGVAIKGSSTSGHYHIYARHCGVAVDYGSTPTPDSNVLEIHARNCTTAFTALEGTDNTAVIRFACDQIDGPAVVVKRGRYIVSGLIRGTGLFILDGDPGEALDVHFALLFCAGLLVNRCRNISGTVRMRTSAATEAVWIREVEEDGSLEVDVRSAVTGIRLGDTTKPDLVGFVIKEGSTLRSISGNGVVFEKTRGCTVTMRQSVGAGGTDFVFEAGANNDTLNLGRRAVVDSFQLNSPTGPPLIVFDAPMSTTVRDTISAVAGMRIGLNTDTDRPEVFDGADWITL